MSDVVLNRRQQAKAQTRERVLDAARFLFANSGYFTVTMRDVARRMQMSTGAIFATVADKAALWTAAMGGPAPDARLAEEVALIQALRPGWTWQLRSDGQQHLAMLMAPTLPPFTSPTTDCYPGHGDSPAEALRQARLSAERHDSDRREAR